MREIKFPPGHRNSALKLKLRGCAGECDPITAIVTLRPEKVGDNIAEQRFLLPVNEWCEVKLDCPELLNFDSCVLLISWFTEPGKPGKLDVDELEWDVSEKAAMIEDFKNRLVDDFSTYNSSEELKKVYNTGLGEIAPAGVTLGEYDGKKVLELSSCHGKMESAAWRMVKNSAGKGKAGGISLSLADINIQPRSGVVYISLREKIDSDDLAVLKIDNYDRQLDTYTLYCPELADMDEFVVVFSTFSCDREEYNVSKELFDIYGGKAVSTTLGYPVKVAITDLQILTPDETVNIIPRPEKMEFGRGQFILSRKAAIVAEDEAENRQAEYS